MVINYNVNNIEALNEESNIDDFIIESNLKIYKKKSLEALKKKETKAVNK